MECPGCCPRHQSVWLGPALGPHSLHYPAPREGSFNRNILTFENIFIFSESLILKLKNPAIPEPGSKPWLEGRTPPLS